MIEKIKNSGFTIELDGDGFIVSPSDKLTQQQCEFMKANKMQIMAELLATVVYTLRGTPITLQAQNAKHQAWLIAVNHKSAIPVNMNYGDTQ
jgi:hypothetical protein